MDFLFEDIQGTTFWENYEAQNTAFQEANLLNIVAQYGVTACDKTPCRTSPLGGEAYIQELITTAHPRRCLEVLRMELHIFLALAVWLEDNTALKESRNHFSIHQKLAIFLQIVGKGESNRHLLETFQHSGATISAVFHEVLKALWILHEKIVILPGPNEPLDSRIAEDTKYFPYFENCLGALDVTHLPAHVPALLAPPYRNRKGWLSQNVLGVCRMDLTFCYVLAGWEGSAHDDRVLEYALFSKNLTIPNNKYYLADAGYHNTDYLLCLYRGVCYHLKEVAAAGKKPTNREELFNLRHSSLRNVVERIFGVTKRRFRIFKIAPE